MPPHRRQCALAKQPITSDINVRCRLPGLDASHLERPCKGNDRAAARAAYRINGGGMAGGTSTAKPPQTRQNQSGAIRQYDAAPALAHHPALEGRQPFPRGDMGAALRPLTHANRSVAKAKLASRTTNHCLPRRLDSDACRLNPNLQPCPNSPPHRTRRSAHC